MILGGMATASTTKGHPMRNATLDHARLLAAAGIVIFHSGAPGAAVGYAALPFFLMLLMLLAWPAAERQPFGAYATGRVRRLMLPWLVWSGVYAALKLAEVALTGRTLGAEFAPWMLLAGPALHLWFLPFAALACLVLWPLARAASGVASGAGPALSPTLAPALRATLAAGLGALAVAALLARQGMALPLPFAQWAYAAPAVALGAGLALLPGWRAQGALLLAVLGLLAAAGWPQGALQIALAGGALVLCLAWPRPDGPVARGAAGMALTVYLVHPLIASVLTRVTALPEASLALAAATLAGSLAFAASLAAVQDAWHRRGAPALPRIGRPAPARG